MTQTAPAISTADMFENLNRDLPFTYLTHYKKNNTDTLALLCDKYGSDKGEVKPPVHLFDWPSHNYTDYYSSLFAHCRPFIRKVFECGLGTNNLKYTANMGVNGKPGASLRIWRDYFPNAEIIGADIDREVLFEEERIKTYYMDQTDPAAIAAFWQEAGMTDIDLMVDDGLHEFHAGVCLFENSIDKLAEHGIYIIEDVLQSDLVKYKDYFLNKPYVTECINMMRVNVALGDNNLVVIRKRV